MGVLKVKEELRKWKEKIVSINKAGFDKHSPRQRGQSPDNSDTISISISVLINIMGNTR